MEKLATTDGSLSKLTKPEIRSSLKASTWDGVFAAVFSSITGGVLLSNFLLDLGANAMEIGLLSSIPMLANFLQPVGAYISEQTNSRHWYSLWIFAPSRSLWLALVVGIAWQCWHQVDGHQLIIWTIAILSVSHLMGALGSASWLSWMAALVPPRLRGRYFGIRNIATNLTNLIGVPLLGIAVAAWPGGKVEGYGAILLLGVIAGIVSLCFQFFMTDVNPKEERERGREGEESEEGRHGEGRGENHSLNTQHSTLHTSYSTPHFGEGELANFLKFLLYFGLWMFAVNVSSPFFNLYMLDNLAIDIRWVTIYTSLNAGASLLMLVVWGKLADRIGNRPLLVLVGILVALTPLMWLGSGNNPIYLWVWFPLLHLLTGGAGIAIDLCGNNLQMAVAPERHQATYFGITAAVAGLSGALGTTAGGFLAQFADYGGLPGIFALSAVLRLVALLPLVFVQEKRSQPLRDTLRSLVGRSAK
ncbi:MAG: MFS transporter [Cyanosarcina radialis HA8281-LM2]|nr:MFS transporter [Cyanosarcina radialis HA8281-LM2]